MHQWSVALATSAWCSSLPPLPTRRICMRLRSQCRCWSSESWAPVLAERVRGWWAELQEKDTCFQTPAPSRGRRVNGHRMAPNYTEITVHGAQPWPILGRLREQANKKGAGRSDGCLTGLLGRGWASWDWCGHRQSHLRPSVPQRLLVSSLGLVSAFLWASHPPLCKGRAENVPAPLVVTPPESHPSLVS